VELCWVGGVEFRPGRMGEPEEARPNSNRKPQVGVFVLKSRGGEGWKLCADKKYGLWGCGLKEDRSGVVDPKKQLLLQV